jgi:hypothetical protein
MWSLVVLACTRTTHPVTESGPDGASAATSASTHVLADFVLDPGRLDADGWTSDPAAPGDVLALDGAVPTHEARRWQARVPVGAGTARVSRACGPVAVPYVASRSVPIVSLPYPACESGTDAPNGLERSERPWSDVVSMTALGLLPDAPSPPPGAEHGPAAFITLSEARVACAWFGGRIPTEREWSTAREGADPACANGGQRRARTRGALDAEARALLGLCAHVGRSGHLDLDGNVEEWLADGRVAGGSFASLPDELGAVRAMPAEARSETIGFRCAFGQDPPAP